MGSREGMQTLEMAMADLVKKGLVSQEDAMAKTSNPAKLNDLLCRAGGLGPRCLQGATGGVGG